MTPSDNDPEGGSPFDRDFTALLSVSLEQTFLDHRDRMLANAILFVAQRVDDLHRRLVHIEQQPKTPFFWKWKHGDGFTIGAFATHRGALWQCERPTDAEPGANADWALVVGTPGG